MEQEIFTKAEAAAFLKKSERTLQDLVRDGYLAGKRDGKSLKFHIDELRAYFNSLPDA